MNRFPNIARIMWILLCGVLLHLTVAGCVFADQDYRDRVSLQQEHYDDLDDVLAEIVFGREVAANILGRYGLYDDPKLTRYVNLVGQGLVLSCGRAELQYYFAVLDSDDKNAFAAPGGYIFVTRGALAAMKDESELAAVLGHELGHVNQKHIVRELKIRDQKDNGGALLSSVIGGMTDPMRVAFAQMVDMATDILLKRGYQQADEAEADRLAVTIPAMAGYDPAAMVNFLNTLSGLSDESKISRLGTHKSNFIRISELKTYLEENSLFEKPSKALKERFVANVQF